MSPNTSLSKSISQRIESLNWTRINQELLEKGFALTPSVISKQECDSLIKSFSDESIYRKVVDMARHKFGRGVYKYFSYPLPPLVQELREQTYPHLVKIANEWSAALMESLSYPSDLPRFLTVCHKAGQARPTPLLLKYEVGDFNCLHQDKYGAVYFPLQMTVFLSEQGEDYTGGEFVLVEQIPRSQSKAYVLNPKRGEIIIFTNQDHPVKGKRGYYRARMRHGVSELLSGTRHTLGVIFHDAE
jgi:uncharacterized protein